LGHQVNRVTFYPSLTRLQIIQVWPRSDHLQLTWSTIVPTLAENSNFLMHVL